MASDALRFNLQDDGKLSKRRYKAFVGELGFKYTPEFFLTICQTFYEWKIIENFDSLPRIFFQSTVLN